MKPLAYPPVSGQAVTSQASMPREFCLVVYGLPACVSNITLGLEEGWETFCPPDVFDLQTHRPLAMVTGASGR